MFLINSLAILVLNASENKDTNVSTKVLVRQSDKETASQNKSRTRLTRPEKFQASIQNRAFGIRNWNNINDKST